MPYHDSCFPASNMGDTGEQGYQWISHNFGGMLAVWCTWPYGTGMSPELATVRQLGALSMHGQAHKGDKLAHDPN